MALFDVIKQNLGKLGSKKGQQATAGQSLGTTAAAQKLAQAGTGKAGATSGPQSTALGEEAAVSQTAAALGQVGDNAKLAAKGVEQGVATQDTAAQAEGSKIERARVGNQQALQRQTNSLFAEIAGSNKKLDMEKDSAKLEQLGTQLRLQDEKYIYKLRDEGRRVRLDDQAEFNVQLQNSVNEDMVSLFEDDIDWRNAFDMEDREFQKWLAGMDIGAAQRLFESQQNADRIQSNAAAASTVASTGAKMYDDKKTSEA